MGVAWRIVEWLRQHNHDAVHLRELNLHRMPKLSKKVRKRIIDKESVTVMDFKTGKKETDENNYMKQLRKYMNTLREIYPDKSINGVIAYIDLAEIKSVS